MGREIYKALSKLDSFGYKYRVFSIEHLKDIEEEIKNLEHNYSDVKNNLGQYLDKFVYEAPSDFLRAKSVIVIAVPQPIARMHFTLNNKKHSVIMPPTYLLNTSVDLEYLHKNISKVTDNLNKILLEFNFSAVKINVPGKLVAVKSGLGSYGKNNICYIDNESSFYWIGVYLTDMPCEVDSWNKESVMEQCNGCTLCASNCPTDAIKDDRFLVYADKRITYSNESSDDLPEWIDPKWHNSIIGCMRCQLICPVNKTSINNVEDFADFNELETKLILDKTPLDKLPKETLDKIEAFNFIGDYEILARNLALLIN